MSEHNTIFFSVGGMSCGGCARKVERVANAIDPSVAAKVDLAAARLQVADTADVGKVMASVRAAGFTIAQMQRDMSAGTPAG